MNPTLLKGLIALVPTSMIFSGAVLSAFRRKTVGSFLQLVGAGCLIIVVLTHICEGLRLFPSMQWGLEHSAGHYVDLWSALLSVLFFPAGYLLDAVAKRAA